MSLIEENYQDEQGNWLPEAQEILAKATATQTTNNGTHALLPLEEAEGALTAISPTSTHTDGGIHCPKCDGECIRTVWVNTVLRAVQLDITCTEPGCDYHLFEPWEVVETKVETP